jgi:NitT/TauT family transport system ATP-binding protein
MTLQLARREKHADEAGGAVGKPQASRPDDVVVFENFGKAFGNGPRRMTATTGINLSIRRGEFVTIVGPSGCGKSTLLNAAAGTFAPTDGRVLYAGNPVAGYNRVVGYMTQSDHLLPWRKVAANVALPLEIRGIPKTERLARVQTLLAQVGLSGFGDHYIQQLSGGMRKRCALARVLAYDPETLLMDEPFSALDAQLRLRIQGEVRSLCRRLGKTVIFVTHDIDEAVALADRCVVLTGRPGTVREVLSVDLPIERSMRTLRSDTTFLQLTERLWDLLAPAEADTSGAPA